MRKKIIPVINVNTAEMFKSQKFAPSVSPLSRIQHFGLFLQGFSVPRIHPLHNQRRILMMMKMHPIRMLIVFLLLDIISYWLELARNDLK